MRLVTYGWVTSHAWLSHVTYVNIELRKCSLCVPCRCVYPFLQHESFIWDMTHSYKTWLWTHPLHPPSIHTHVHTNTHTHTNTRPQTQTQTQTQTHTHTHAHAHARTGVEDAERGGKTTSQSITCQRLLGRGIIDMCDMTHVCVTWLIYMCVMTHPYLWHDLFICVTWLIYACDVTHSHICDMTHLCVSFICVTWLIHMCDMTHAYVSHDSFVCVV